MQKLLWVSAVAAALAIGCGGKTDNANNGTGGTGAGGSGATGGNGATGGSGGSGAVGATGGNGATGGSGAVGGSGGMPNECSVPTSEPGPYPVKFVFTNPTGQKIFVREDCQLNWSLYSCADGYSSELAHSADCTMDCSEPSNGCIACGACMMNALEVSPTSPVQTDFSGFTYTFGQSGAGCQCHNQLVALPGKYSIKVPVYLSEQEAMSGQMAWEAWVDFTLPAPSGVVEVPLIPPMEG